MTMQRTYRQIMVGLILLVGISALALGGSSKTQAWIDVLQSEVSLFEKCRACQQLGESGSKEAVPVLASLLTHETLSVYARTGLERIPGPEGRTALRNALTQIQGRHLIGVIHSLATLRDEGAVEPLIGLTHSPDQEIVKAALLSLGRIATEDAMSAVLRALAGPSGCRSEAASACLLAAQSLLRAEKTVQACAIYEAVRKADVPLSFRIGATRGAILSRQADATSFLIDQLRSSEPAIRNVAILTIRQNPKEAFASALNAEIDQAAPELQAQMLEAFKDCHNPQSLARVRARVNTPNPSLRLTALMVLREIGGPDAAPVLIKVLQENRDATEVSLVVGTLEQMQGPDIDALILKALSLDSGSKVRVELIRLLGKRSVKNATGQLFRQAADPDTQVCVAACQALGRLAGLGELPRLIQLTGACQETRVRDAAALAVYEVCQRKPKDQAATWVFQALKNATATSEKLAWIRVLVLLGHSDSLPTIVAMLQDPDETLVQRTLFYVGQWPDPSPIQDLFSVVESHSNATLRTRALVAVLQLGTRAAEQEQRASETLMRWFQRASKAAQSTREKRLLISGLSRIKQGDSIRLLASYLDASDVKMEAIYAIVNAAGPVTQGPEYGVVEAALEKIGDVQDTGLRSKIAALKQTIKATKAKMNKANDIDQMIQKNRMGVLMIQAKPGATVRVEQIKHEFWFGAALSSSAFNGRYSAEDTQRYRETFLANFNAAVTENALKWHAMESRKGRVDYSVVDAMLDWTETHEIPLRGHNIFWGIPGRVQKWLKALDDTALREALRVRATTIARRYKGRFAEYDLNNEMIHGNYYADRLGPDITRQMVNWIKQVDPKAQLYLNDYDILTTNRLDEYMTHIHGFLQTQVAIDGVGVQGHLHGDSFDPVKLHQALDTLAQAGLPLCITEFNFPGQRSRVYQKRDIKLTPEAQQAKAKALVEYYRICFAHASVKGILMWGFWERANWIPQSSLFLRDWTETPAAKAYRDLIFNQWWTQCDGQADEEGHYRVSAFFGTHRVIVDGHEKTVDLRKSAGQATVSFK